MKTTLLTIALSACLLPATFAQQSSSTSSQSSSSTTTTTDRVSSPQVVRQDTHDTTTTNETRARYGKHGSKVTSKKSVSRTDSTDVMPTSRPAETTTTHQSEHESHSSSTNTNPPQE